jgi:hypothetical protein
VLPRFFARHHAGEEQRGWPGNREAVQEHHQRDVLDLLITAIMVAGVADA